MKAVFSPVPEHILAWRKETGADRFDEMWEGVLHMGPLATKGHERFRFELQSYLDQRWRKRTGGEVCSMNVCPPGGWPHNYRVPDLILWTPDRAWMDRETHFEGPPLVAIEIYSGPDDEAYDKLPFYAALGVPEVWIIDRDSKQVDLFVLDAGQYRELSPDTGGWLVSAATGIELQPRGGGKLRIRIEKDAASLAELPEV
jgi:Uma2 family endonuclease